MFSNTVSVLKASQDDRLRAEMGIPPKAPREESAEYQQCMSDCDDLVNASKVLRGTAITACAGAVGAAATGVPISTGIVGGAVTGMVTKVLEQHADSAECMAKCELRFSPQPPPQPVYHTFRASNLHTERGRDQWFDRQMNRGRR